EHLVGHLLRDRRVPDQAQNEAIDPSLMAGEQPAQRSLVSGGNAPDKLGVVGDSVHRESPIVRPAPNPSLWHEQRFIVDIQESVSTGPHGTASGIAAGNPAWGIPGQILYQKRCQISGCQV